MTRRAPRSNIVRASIATPESDALLSAMARRRGRMARELGQLRDNCPFNPNSLIASWWFEGWDEAVSN